MKRRLSNLILYSTALLFAVLLFTQKRDYSLTSFQHAWNTGHLIVFWLWTYLMLTRWSGLATRSYWQQILICMTIVVLVSFAIEGIQHLTGRTFSVDDIRKNIVGSAAALCFTRPRRIDSNKWLRHGIQITVLVALIVELAPLGRAVIDDIIIYRQFPVLCSFETPFEKERWRSITSLHIDRNIKKEGRASLKVNSSFGVYTRTTLLSMARNWTGFRYLELDLYNPLSKVIYIRLTVHDELFRRRGYLAKDHFVRPYTLPHGWNHIRIPIEDIRTGPREREMQMTDIRELEILVWQHGKPRAIYIDGLKLSSAP
jgi:VanZ family protein